MVAERFASASTGPKDDESITVVSRSTGNVTFNTIPTGIDGVKAEGGAPSTVKVYSLDGRFVREAAPAEALSGLQKGVYIVNGRKLMVK